MKFSAVFLLATVALGVKIENTQPANEVQAVIPADDQKIEVPHDD